MAEMRRIQVPRNDRPAGEVPNNHRAIIDVTGYVLKNLALDDPFVRSVGLTRLANLYEKCADTYGLRDLRQLIEFKLEKIDDLYNMIVSYRARSAYGLPRRRQLSLLIAAVVCAFVAIGCGLVLPGRLNPPFLPWLFAGVSACAALALWLAWLLRPAKV